LLVLVVVGRIEGEADPAGEGETQFSHSSEITGDIVDTATAKSFYQLMVESYLVNLF